MTTRIYDNDNRSRDIQQQQQQEQTEKKRDKKKNVTDQLLDVGAVKVHRDVVDVCGACVNVHHERQSVALAAEAIER